MTVFKTVQPMRKFYSHPMCFLWESLYGVRKWAVAGMSLAFCLQLMKVCVPVFFSDMIEYFSPVKSSLVYQPAKIHFSFVGSGRFVTVP